MARHICQDCGYVYDPDAALQNRISSSNIVQDVINSYYSMVTPMDDSEVVQFDKLPEDWTCPRCGAGKAKFEPE